MVEGKEKKLGFQISEKEGHMESQIIIAKDRAQKRVTNAFWRIRLLLEVTNERKTTCLGLGFLYT